MKDEKEKSSNDSKGKRKRNEDKLTNENNDIFNPHLSARELKKIQYYENMFKKMEQKKEDNIYDGDYKNKKKPNKIKKSKKLHTHKKELNEYIEISDKKNVNNFKRMNSNKDIDSCKSVYKNEGKKNKHIICDFHINQNANEKFSKRKESIIKVKKEQLCKHKNNNSKNIENSSKIITKSENDVNSNLFSSANNYRMNKLHDNTDNYILNKKNSSRTIVNKLKNNKIIDIKMNRKNFLFKNNKLLFNYEKGYISDSIINYNNINEIKYEGNKRYLGNEKNILKIRRSVSACYNRNEYFSDNSKTHLKNTYNYNESEIKISYKNYNLHSFENEKRRIRNYLINNMSKKTNNFEECLRKGKLNKNISDLDSIFQIKNNVNSINGNLKSSIESDDNLKLYLNDKEVTDENMNSKSCSIEYFNEEENERKKERNNELNFKSHIESNNISSDKKRSNVNYCIKKYLDNMRYTNLKKLKKINKENVKIYVRSCVNFLNFNNFDNAILCLLNFQNTLQKKGKK